MTAPLLVFAPTRPGEDSLECSLWMAKCNRDRLNAEGFSTIEAMGSDALPEALDERLPEASALLYFGHGDEEHLGSADAEKPSMGPGNVHLLSDRWAHAVACRAGVRLADLAVEKGAILFAGYDAAIILDWSPTNIPAEIAGAFRIFISETSVLLARGVREIGEIQRRLEAVAERIVLWCQDDGSQGLEITAQQLIQRLVVRRAVAAT